MAKTNDNPFKGNMLSMLVVGLVAGLALAWLIVKVASVAKG